MATQGFGKPKYGGASFVKNIRLKEGAPTVVRVLPPMKALADTGEWAVYTGTHFGYKGVNPQDRSKPTYRTFKCIEERDYKTKMILQDCPECDLIAQRKAEQKDLQDQAKAAGHDEEQIAELVKPLKDWLSDHNCDRKWHMNVKQQDGIFAVLQISHKTKKLLDAEISRLLTEDGIDALEPDQGVWFRFTRSGRGIDTQDTVTVEYESVRDSATNRVVRTVKTAPLTDAEAEKALKECPDLSKNVREITYEQIKLLADSSGDDEEVDKILALGEKKESSPPGRAVSTPRPTVQPKPQEKVAVTPPPVVAAEEDDEEAEALRALEAIKARKAALKSTPEPAKAAVEVTDRSETKSVAPTPASTPAPGLPVDRAAFMARFNKPKIA